MYYCLAYFLIGVFLLQAMAEFESVDDAKRVVEALHGSNIYPECCSMKVEFCKKAADGQEERRHLLGLHHQDLGGGRAEGGQADPA